VNPSLLLRTRVQQRSQRKFEDLLFVMAHHVSIVQSDLTDRYSATYPFG